MSLRIVACAGNFLSYWRDYRAEPETHDDPDNRPAKQLTRIRLIPLIALRDMDFAAPACRTTGWGIQRHPTDGTRVRDG
jgi:hypothetical protein